MERIAGRVRRYGFDVLLVLVAIEGLLEVATGSAELESSTPPWFGGAAVVALVLPLVARRRFPFGAPSLVWVLGAGLAFVDSRLAATSFSVYLVGVMAAYLLGNLPDPARARTGLAIVLTGATLVALSGVTSDVSDFVTVPATFAIAWLAGLALRARAELAEQAELRATIAERETESMARIAVAEERSRITRELHDVVAHAVSVMVLQVGAVRHRLPDSLPEDKEVLRGVEDTGRSALNEMRRLFVVIHEDDGEVDLSPQPGLDRLDRLVEEVRLAGLDVRLHRRGEPLALPRAIDLSAFRIVQEGLTNCLKHAGATRVDVTVSHSPDDLRIEVVDNGVGPTTGDGRGRGITGIRERVKIYGGEMTMGAGPDGGFKLDVRLPVGGSRR